MSRPNAEILVHIAAPSRTTDDTDYRTLASAYLNFVPKKRIPLVVTEKPSYNVPGEDGRDFHDYAEAPSTQEPRTINSPNMSFQSVYDNMNSPRLQQVEDGGFQGSQSQSSWRAPPSVVPDSIPDNNLAMSQFCSPTRILEHFLDTFDSSQDHSPKELSSFDGQNLPTHTASHKTQNPAVSSPPPYSSSPESNHDETIIPLSPILSTVDGNVNINNKRPRPTTPPSVSYDETRISSSYPNPSEPSQPDPTSLEERIPSSRAESEPPTAKRPRLSVSSAPKSPPADSSPTTGKAVLARSTSDIGPRQERAKAQRSAAQGGGGTLTNVFSSTTLEIFSPAPPAGIHDLDPADLVTDALAELARELNLAKRFRPSSQTREVRPFERGYWLVDCSSWDGALKQSCWSFLGGYLPKGAAGWGVWCGRDAPFSWLRMYCFGHAVGHIYLLLYLVSKRRVLYTGAEWVAGDGAVVVVMEGKGG
ncbi:hypothetical protein B0T17DRAFT_486911 [Bombardia bombarda]|uniref:Uncharacterized protein n=1 Tax=Bombardia bombarda TaxID=252184 RepID=A0AA39X6Y6_9PEZI|nr:hypothetical protein B0T17DRAFT_486911 [Bombardia bombarda]